MFFHNHVWIFLLGLLTIIVALTDSYPVHQMRICIQSVDPSRLPSQCIYCKTRLFPLTVRLCTSNNYLPARMSLNEAFCLTTACRRQLPRMPPEPYPSAGPSIAANAAVANSSPNVGVNGNSDENSYSSMGSAMNGESNSEENYEEAESLMAQQPTKVRPPAKFFLGKPQKYPNPMRPLIFG